MGDAAGPIRIVILSNTVQLGGADKQVVALAQGLRRRGCTVSVLTLSPLGPMGHEAHASGLSIKGLGFTAGHPSPRRLMALVSLLRRTRPHVLICFMYHAIVLGRVAGALTSVPVVIASLRNEFLGGRLRDKILRITDGLGNVTTANSRAVAGDLVRRGVVPAKRMLAIPNAIDTAPYGAPAVDSASVRSELGVQEKEFLWLTIGRLGPTKDYPNLLRAFAHLAARYPRARLWIVGVGALQDQIKREVETLQLTERVSFLGARRDVPALLRAADGFVLASAWEGMPNAVMEALASRVPVVATEVGGVCELVEDGISGYTVPPKDAEALGTAMERVMNASPESRRRMGEAGRTRMEREYGLERVIDLWHRLCCELLAPRTSPQNQAVER